MSPFKAGMIAVLIILVVTAFGFTRYNPLHQPFQLQAVFRSANNLQKNSPVRIAGVNVGKVKTVDPIKGGGARVVMAIEKPGLPIHKDAQLKIRPRIFLEGNFFVDISPGTPTAPSFHDGDTVPVQQTATPVQFGQLLTALQADTRQDLQTFLFEYAHNALGNGGAQAYNNSLKYAPGALRNASIANEATLGQQPHDLSNLERGQQRLFRSLSSNPGQLKDLIVQLNTTASAFAREDVALGRSIPLLRDTLRAGTPALQSVDAALPTLRTFAREALPGVRSSGPAIDASLPLITQLRLLVRPQELRGLVADLRPTIPALARLNHASIPFLNESRALSACQNNVLLPWSKKGIPNPEEPAINNQPFYKQGARGFVGLASESRLTDANTPLFHIQAGSGPTNLVYTHGNTRLIASAAQAPEGTRPALSVRPKFRPGEPCELQQVPDLNAPRGSVDPGLTATGPGGIGGLIPIVNSLPIPSIGGLLPKSKSASSAAGTKSVLQAAQVQWNEIQDYVRRTKAGQPAVNPWNVPRPTYLKKMQKIGLKVLPSGKVVQGVKK
jgi:ABC-type transporter Mla subunit MlaD